MVSPMRTLAPPRVAGLFAGIGGRSWVCSEVGSRRSFCVNGGIQRRPFAGSEPEAEIVGDVQELDHLPDVELVTAKFPCTDLLQAGRTRIKGEASGLVAEVFRLLRGCEVPTLMLENVRNMLVLDSGAAMRFLVDELESLGYRWAYRLVDSRFTGVPQRRQRVVLWL